MHKIYGRAPERTPIPCGGELAEEKGIYMKKINIMLAAAALTMGMMGVAQAADGDVTNPADRGLTSTGSEGISFYNYKSDVTVTNGEGTETTLYKPNLKVTYSPNGVGHSWGGDESLAVANPNEYFDNSVYAENNTGAMGSKELCGYGSGKTQATAGQLSLVAKYLYGNDEMLADAVNAVGDEIGDLDGLRPNVKDYLLTDDPTVVDAINANSDALAAEVAARKGADAAQDKVINQINQNVADGFTALSAVDAAEAQAREAGDKALADQLAAEKNDRIWADKAQDKVIQQVNQNLVDNVTTINQNMAAGFNALSAVDQAEAQAREAGDAAEAAAREAADKTLQNNIDAEAQTRAAADAELQSNIDRVDRDSKKGIARAVALAGLHPLDYDPDNKLDIAAAGGFYKNQNAFAIGAFYRPNRNVMVSFGTSVTGSDDAYNVGVSFKVGRSGEKKAKACPSTEDLYAMLSAMQEKIDAQQARIEELEAK